MEQAHPEQDLDLRTLSVADAVDLQKAVIACPPLTLHTPYTYWVILSRSPDLCFGAWAGGELAAFSLAVPTFRRHAFIWQIGVLPELRGQRLGQHLLDRVWHVARESGLTAMEATIAVDNESSIATFRVFAETHELGFQECGEIVSRDAVGAEAEREIEYLLRPLDS